MSGVQTFVVRGDNEPLEIGLGDAGGLVAVASGGSTVYYRDEPGVSATVNDGSIAAGASATLYGTQWLVVSRTVNTTTGQYPRADVQVRASSGLASGATRHFVGTSRADASAQAASELASGVPYSYAVVSSGGALLDLGGGKVS
jgi:hypothetical protein